MTWIRDHEPRPVEVEQDGHWWPGLLHGWRRDERGWVADVSWYQDHERGRGQYVQVVPAARVRPR